MFVNPYLSFFRAVDRLGLHKTAVRIARSLERFTEQPLDNSKLYDAVWLFAYEAKFPMCNGPYGCYLPILSDTDRFHGPCRAREDMERAYYDALDEQAQRDFEQQLEAEALAREQRGLDAVHLEMVLEEFCNHYGCWQNRNSYSNECNEHDDSPAYDDDDNYDMPCQGGCGQTERTCTCAELESWHRHNADPATRGSFWYA